MASLATLARSADLLEEKRKVLLLMGEPFFPSQNGRSRSEVPRKKKKEEGEGEERRSDPAGPPSRYWSGPRLNQVKRQESPYIYL